MENTLFRSDIYVYIIFNYRITKKALSDYAIEKKLKK